LFCFFGFGGLFEGLSDDHVFLVAVGDGVAVIDSCGWVGRRWFVISIESSLFGIVELLQLV
jgi:hypothetical protein